MRVLARLALVWSLLAATTLGAQESSTGAQYTYDNNGNLTSKTEAGVLWTYRYDSRDLLHFVRRNGLLVASYTYDHEGRRTSRTTPEEVVRYLWDGERIVAEQDEAGRTIARYVYAGDRLIVVEHETEGRGAYLFDGLGSPVSLSRPDGTLAVRYRYDAWGSIAEQTGESANPFLFTGHLFDGITGLYYAKARYYDPVVGRFTAVDPFEGTAVEPRSQHPYQYAYANPTAHVDRDGRCVGDLQQSAPCQAISRVAEHFMVGDALALAERDLEIHQKVVAGRRQFKRDFGRDPLPDEVVWSDARGGFTAGFELVDFSGAALPDHAEWSFASAGVGGRLAYVAARTGGAAVPSALAAGARATADDLAGELVGISPSEVHSLARLAGGQGLARTGQQGVSVIGESANRPGVDLTPLPADSASANLNRGWDEPLSAPRLASGADSPGHSSRDQPRDAHGRFLSRTTPNQLPPGKAAVDDFIANAENQGFEVVGREVTVGTPFGQRRYDLVLRDPATRQTHAVEIKSSQRAFERFDAASRRQFAADRWVVQQGAVGVGAHRGLEIQSVVKVLWEPAPPHEPGAKKQV